MSLATDPRGTPVPVDSSRFHAWPLWMSAAGLLGMVGTLFTDQRPAGEQRSTDHTVSVADIPELDHLPFRIGGLGGFLCVAALLVFAAVWRRRVSQRYDWSIGASVVSFGAVAAAGALTLAYGWKGALGNYLHGAIEEGSYDDAGLYTYYVMNDFSPFIAALPLAIALGGVAWMGLREGLVSRGPAVLAGLVCVLAFAAVAATGVPGLPFIALPGFVLVGIWLSLSRSRIVQEDLS
ncbi:hypothetical protein KVF89_20205 [Nocardioides carbamazepini]|uniref:hypothetical protein n=1 Tax=Nocardioides carbamazepini TaxID=2854259 RepID=UPI00214A0E25|nr:hypothetical protein [Nocardioides carbamazepini]MCR1784875.1 hypothetical protein [Nocardioides carbamazepini]